MKFPVITLLHRTCAIVATTVILILGSDFSASATTLPPDTVVMEVQNDNPEKADENEGLNVRITLMGFGAVAILLVVAFVGWYFFGDNVKSAENQHTKVCQPRQTTRVTMAHTAILLLGPKHSLCRPQPGVTSFSRLIFHK